MKDTHFVVNEFEQYCDSLDEDCPVALLDALELLKFFEQHEHEVCGNCPYNEPCFGKDKKNG